MRIKSFLASLLAVFSLFFVYNSAHAAWTHMQGTQTVVEYPASNTSAIVYRGWGLDYTQKAGFNQWVHASIPTVQGGNVKQVWIRYYSSQAAGIIDVVDVYYGETKLVSVPVTTVYAAAGWRTVTFTVPLLAPFRGVSLSMHTVAPGVNTRFIISDVAALW